MVKFVDKRDPLSRLAVINAQYFGRNAPADSKLMARGATAENPEGFGTLIPWQTVFKSPSLGSVSFPGDKNLIRVTELIEAVDGKPLFDIFGTINFDREGQGDRVALPGIEVYDPRFNTEIFVIDGVTYEFEADPKGRFVYSNFITRGQPQPNITQSTNADFFATNWRIPDLTWQRGWEAYINLQASQSSQISLEILIALITISVSRDILAEA